MVVYELTDLCTWVLVKLSQFLSTASEVRIEFYDPRDPISNNPDVEDSTVVDRRYLNFQRLRQWRASDKPMPEGGTSKAIRPAFLPRSAAVRRNSQDATPLLRQEESEVPRVRGITVEEVGTMRESLGNEAFVTPPPYDPFQTPARTSTIAVPPAIAYSSSDPGFSTQVSGEGSKTEKTEMALSKASNPLGEGEEFYSVNSVAGTTVRPVNECRPVLYSVPGTTLRILAVRVIVYGASPRIFPLSREDLGRVWESSEMPVRWREESDTPVTWVQARDNLV